MLLAILKGTVNDATTFPPPSKSHGSYHWAFERMLAASLIPIMGGAAVSTGSAYVSQTPLNNRGMEVDPRAQPILDGLLGVSLIIHSHMGFDACVVDYFHPRKWPVIGPLMTWVLRGATGLAVWGLYEFNTNDIGQSHVHRTLTASREEEDADTTPSRSNGAGEKTMDGLSLTIPL